MPNAFHGWRRAVTVAVAVAAVLSGASLARAQGPSLEIFNASVVYDETTKPGKAGRADVVHVIIERWSTEEERQALVQAYDQKGASGLLSALRKTEPLGTLRTSIAESWDLHYAVQTPTADGGRRIVVGTDREIEHWEVDSKEKSSYPFTLVELRLDKDGKGDGRISLGTRIHRSKDGKTIELEHYSTEYVRLRDVKKQRN